MTERCELSDLPVDQCACRIHAPKADPPVRRDYVITARFSARFNSECDGCGNRMLEDDPICRTSEGDYICWACASR